MIKKVVLVILCMFLVIPALAGNLEIVDYELLPLLQDNPDSLMLFAAELNISNGDPYSRDYGERGMFGRLESAESIRYRTDEFDAEKIYAEVYRLLFGPWKNDGSTEFLLKPVGKGKVLSYETGKWSDTKGGMAIRIKHVTEYYNSVRYRYLLLSDNGDAPQIYTHYIIQ